MPDHGPSRGIRFVRWALALALCAPAGQSLAVEVDSRMPGVHVVATGTLPPARQPMRFEAGDYCGDAVVRPATPAGRHAAGLGWHVAGEIEAGGYTSVAIFSRGTAATSGTCLVQDGNVVVYRGDTPVAIVYGDPPPPHSNGRIGAISRPPSPDRVRIDDGTPLARDAGDLLLAPDRISVVPLPDRETLCGDLTVPRIEGDSIAQARNALRPFGWLPVKQARPTGDDRLADLHRAGLDEVETCSGTGFGFCRLHYRHASGALLDVTTSGDPPAVSAFEATCPRPEG